MTPKVVVSVKLSTSLQTLYTVPASTMAQIPGFWMMNTHSAAVTVTIELIPAGGSDAQVENQAFVVSVPAGLPDSLPFTFHLAVSGFIRAKASVANVVSMFVSPIERPV